MSKGMMGGLEHPSMDREMLHKKVTEMRHGDMMKDPEAAAQKKPGAQKKKAKGKKKK